MYHKFSPQNPFRSADWRWQRAGLIVDGTLPMSRKRDTDPWLRKAVAFRRRYNDCVTPLETTLLAEEEPEIFWAYEMFRVADNDRYQISYRYEVEARILAEDDDATIAEKTGMEPGAIEAYEKLFYNVRPRLNQQSYVIHQVLGPAVQRGLANREYDLLWKLFGYMRGPHMLDFAVMGITAERTKTPTADVVRVWRQDLSTQMTQQAGYTARMMKSFAETQKDIIECYVKLVEQERLAGAAGGTQDALMGALTVFLSNSNSFQCGPPTKHDELTRVVEYDRGAIELSSSDLIRCAAGGDPEIDPRILSVKFPEPKAALEGNTK